MKKYLSIFAACAVMMVLSLSLVACSDDDDDSSSSSESGEVDIYNLKYSDVDAASWGNYMRIVASLLQSDSDGLYQYWSSATSTYGGVSYADIFKNHNSTYYASANDCVQEMIAGCADIANEVGSSKIGEPYYLYVAGQTTAALYAVESWYSYHSRDDYRNNIYSIRNTFYGSLDGTVNENSLSAILADYNPTMNAQVIALINTAAAAIYAIPQPFRNNIDSDEAAEAMDACGELETYLTQTVAPYFETITDEDVLQPAVEQFVDAVVLPTYEELAELNAALYTAVLAFQQSPSDDAFATCAEAWLEAREPWEKSEAFLWGPVADKGLDPNMDSWPLDQAQIYNVLTSGDYSELEWDGDYDEEDDDIAAAQSVRGYHTLEYLIFMDGEARTVE